MDQKFIEIRDVDAYGEVMDLQGELKVAQIEIRRLRKQLTLSGSEIAIDGSTEDILTPNSRSTAPRVSPTAALDLNAGN